MMHPLVPALAFAALLATSAPAAASPPATTPMPVPPTTAATSPANLFHIDPPLFIATPFEARWTVSQPPSAQTIDIRPAADKPLTITSARPLSPDSGFAAKLTTLEPGRHYSLQVTPADTRLPRSGGIELVTDPPQDKLRPCVVWTYISHQTVSDSGKFRLVLRSTARERYPWDTARPSLTARFDFQPVAPAGTSPDLFVDGFKLRKALAGDGTDLTADAKSPGWTDNQPCSLTLNAIPFADDATTLSRVEITVTTVTVTKWQTLTFENLTAAKAGPHHCGPFELHTSGNDTTFTVAAYAGSDFQAERDAFFKKIPLHFLHHQYALNSLEITQANGKPFTAGCGVFTGGSGANTYSNAILARPGAKSSPEPVAYPIHIKLRLPQEYQTRTETFTIKDIPLPSKDHPQQPHN